MNQRFTLGIVAIIACIGIGIVIGPLIVDWFEPGHGKKPLAAAEQAIKAEQWSAAAKACTEVGDDTSAGERDRQRANDWKSQIEAIEQAIQHEDKAEWSAASTAWENVLKQLPADDCWNDVRPKLKERRELSTLKNELTELKQAARDLQQTKNWCDAKQMWEQIRDKSNENEQLAIFHQDALGNIRLLDGLCNPKEKPVTETEVPKLPKAERPKNISHEDLIKYYPVGRSIRSLSLLNVKGTGVNRQWGIQGTAHFNYQSRTVVQTTVTENTRTRLEFIVDFRTVDQTLVVSKKKLELDLPENPILSTIWGHFEGIVLRPNPAYVLVRHFVTITMIYDPRLKRLLTWLGNQLDLSAGEEMEMVAQIDKLSGKKFRLTYVSGLGVKQIEDLSKTGLFTRNELIELAYNSSLLMDYYIVPGADKQVGDEWTVRAQDVGKLLDVGSDTRLSGEMTLKREEDSTKTSDKDQAVLSIVSGNLTVEQDDPDEGDQQFRVKVGSGILDYSQKDLLVREARLTLDASTLWINRNSLLFNTEKIRDLQIKAYYEAELVSPGTDSP